MKMGLLFLCLFLNFSILRSQDFVGDLNRLGVMKTKIIPQKIQVSYIFKNKKPIIKYNPVSLVFGGMLFGYQKILSTQIASECPYEISCSNFSKQCISEYGLTKGVALSADRLLRCNKLALADLHPLFVTKQNSIIDSVQFYSIKH